MHSSTPSLDLACVSTLANFGKAFICLLSIFWQRRYFSEHVHRPNWRWSQFGSSLRFECSHKIYMHRMHYWSRHASLSEFVWLHISLFWSFSKKDLLTFSCLCLSGIRRLSWNPIPGDQCQECHQRRASIHDDGSRNQESHGSVISITWQGSEDQSRQQACSESRRWRLLLILLHFF